MLNWSLRNIARFKSNRNDYYYTPVVNKKGQKVFDINPITKYLVYQSMVIGLDEITKSNADEWLIRLQFVNRLYGTSLMTRDDKNAVKPYKITFEDLERHIGLKTNSHRFTRRKLVSNCVSGMMKDITNQTYKDVERERLQKDKELAKKVVPISSGVKKAINDDFIS